MKPQIRSVSITIARNYAYCFTVYESGRQIMKHINVKPEKFMLYPMEFLRCSRSITHIVNQLAVNGCIPMSIDNWMFQEHPKAAWKDNEFDDSIFTFRLDKDECLVPGYEEFNY